MTGEPSTGTRARRLAPLTIVAVALVSFLTSDPGQVSADSRQYLYLDPGSFLRRAVSLWDPTIAAGTVPHQHLGFLWPMGPWFWIAERLGSPVWFAQRLWLSALAAVAGLGLYHLCRRVGLAPLAALVAALDLPAQPLPAGVHGPPFGAPVAVGAAPVARPVHASFRARDDLASAAAVRHRRRHCRVGERVLAHPGARRTGVGGDRRCRSWPGPSGDRRRRSRPGGDHRSIRVVGRRSGGPGSLRPARAPADGERRHRRSGVGA